MSHRLLVSASCQTVFSAFIMENTWLLASVCIHCSTFKAICTCPKEDGALEWRWTPPWDDDTKNLAILSKKYCSWHWKKSALCTTFACFLRSKALTNVPQFTFSANSLYFWCHILNLAKLARKLFVYRDKQHVEPFQILFCYNHCLLWPLGRAFTCVSGVDRHHFIHESFMNTLDTKFGYRTVVVHYTIGFWISVIQLW